MILADTSIWIEFLRGDREVSAMMENLMNLQGVLAVGVIFAELLQGARTSAETQIILNYWKNLPHADESDLWILAGKLSFDEKLYARGVGLIDAFLVVCARKHRCKLWTLDKKLKSTLKAAEIYE